MLRKLTLALTVAFVATLAGEAVAATPTAAVPLVSDPSVHQAQVVPVKKRRKKSSDDEGEKGWFDYLKMSFTFDGEEVVDEVKDGRIVEHILGGFFASLGGHIWAPMVSYKEIEERPSAAMTLGIVSTILAWSWLPWLLVWWIPYVGWVLVSLIILAHMGVVAVINYWFIPRAIQFAYSDAYAGGGGSSKKKRRSSDDDEDDEE